ncbi:MAG: hypothetical protein CTY40_08550 [Hyphomicrobium sp.]|nr:MAG: hypothetical protein CTY40_08550 [Hyphomicrobium sp.]
MHGSLDTDFNRFEAEGRPMVQQRDTMKTKRTAALPVATARGASGATKGPTTATSASALEKRVAELERELAMARERVALLEAERGHVLNRIDWAIDSLHTVIESEA